MGATSPSSEFLDTKAVLYAPACASPRSNSRVPRRLPLPVLGRDRRAKPSRGEGVAFKPLTPACYLHASATPPACARHTSPERGRDKENFSVRVPDPAFQALVERPGQAGGRIILAAPGTSCCRGEMIRAGWRMQRQEWDPNAPKPTWRRGTSRSPDRGHGGSSVRSFTPADRRGHALRASLVYYHGGRPGDRRSGHPHDGHCRRMAAWAGCRGRRRPTIGLPRSHPSPRTRRRAGGH